MTRRMQVLAQSSLFAIGCALVTSVPAFAQQASGQSAQPSELEEIVVTGTSIRGVAPVGANLISVGQEAIEATGAQTISDALRTIPALSNAGATGQGPTVAFYQPSIHNLGASASNSTLVLIDGHRGPTGGTNHTFLDPNIIPPLMLERVEVLPEGASSVYGSDAVAGVVNFITRRRFDGIRATGRYVFSDGTEGYSGGLMFGRTWDTGSAVFAANYSLQGALASRSRDSTFPDQRARGGTSFMNFSCSPATIQPGGTGNIFLSPTSGQSVVNSSANAPCTGWGYGDLIGEERRHQVMGKITQQFGENLTVGLDLLYARRRNESAGGSGTVQATVFQTGPQANPFYTTPVGYTGTATNQVIRWDSTELFGPARNFTGSDTVYASFTANYKITEDWDFDLLAAAGGDESGSWSEGTINGSVATLALNGTTNGGGNMTAPSIPGTTVAILNLPLTPENALDVWRPAATNRTSAAVREALLDNDNMLENVSGFQQLRGSISGPLFDMPAGAVRMAVGAELYRTQLSQFVSRANNAGRASAISQQLNFDFDREVHSFYGELNIPIVSEDMGVPFVQSFDLNLAGRHDSYDDVGKTTNPKVAFSWDVSTGFRFRGNYSTSFVAPPLTTIGDEFGAFGTAGWNSVGNNVPVPVAAYPVLPQMGIPGCTAASVTCNIQSLQGVQVTKGDPSRIGPQDGKGWSLGVDFAPAFVPGFRASFTFWDTSFRGGVTGPNLQNAVNTASANHLLTFYPGGATAEQLAAVTRGIPQRSTTPATIDYIFQSLNSNYLNLDIQGFDYQIGYSIPTETMGDFSFDVSGTEFVKFTQSFGSGETYDILNTTGNNTTFPSIKRQLRAGLGWRLNALSADLFANYTGGYRNWSGNSVNPITRDANGNPSGGGDRVASNLTIDTRVAYTIGGSGFFDDVEVSVAARNLFNKTPPFYNSSGGYDSMAGNPFGRTITLSVRADF